MIKLPEYQQRERTAALPTPNVSARISPDQIDGGMGKALGQIGQQFMDIAIKERDAADTTAVLEADRKLSQWQVGALYGENGALTRKGKDTLGLPDETSKAFDSYYSEVAAGLTSDKQRMALSKLSADRKESMQRTLYQHSSSEMERHYDGEFKASIDTARSAAALAYGDPKKVDEELQRGAKIIAANAVRKGLGEEARTAAMRSWTSTVHRDVLVRLIDDDPYKARDWLSRNRSNMTPEDAEKIDTILRPAIERSDGIRLADQVSKLTLPEGKGFDRAVNLTMKLEGGYVANDAGKGETNMGINKTANPDVNVRELTPDQAKALYRERYWNAIGAEKLSPAMQIVAFDAAVNHGPSATAKMLAAAGGDPGKLIELRRAEYQRLLKQDPQKYGKYAKAWESRLQLVEAAAAVPEGGSNEAALIRMAEKSAPSPKAAEVAVKELKDRFASDKARRAEESNNRYIAASEIAFTQGWRAVPPLQWGELSDSERAKLMAGPPKSSDLDTLLELDTKPDLRVKGKIEQFRHLLTPADYRRYYAMGNGPDREMSAAVDPQQLNQVLLQTGMWKLAASASSMSDADKQEKVRLVASLEQMIDAEQRAKKRPLSMDEKNSIYRTALKEVTIRTRTTGSFLGLGDGQSEDTRRVYQVQNPRNIKVPGEMRQRIISFLKGRGIPTTESNIIEAYLDIED